MIGGDWGIYPEVKVMMALKQLAFGCAPSAFLDYFQMGNTSGQKCLKMLCKLVANSPLRDEYLRSYTKADVRRISALHEAEFGVAGCIGCLDCMHVFWRLCPVAWHGQYQGKDGYASMVLEAVADYTCWIWHAKFGFPGTLNDINIWDRSTLLRMMLDGTFTQQLDFTFTIAGIEFNKLWLFVDGIYPELSRFVKTISVPIGAIEKRFVKWQEGKRKSVERAFGILQRKFQILCRPMEYWFEDDIKNITETCIILHNMMVEVRISRDQLEEDEWYQMVDGDWDEDEMEHPVVPSTQQKIDAIADQFPALNDAAKKALIRDALLQQFDDSQSEWEGLYNRDRHFALRSAIMQQLEDNRKNNNN